MNSFHDKYKLKYSMSLEYFNCRDRSKKTGYTLSTICLGAKSKTDIIMYLLSE